MSGSLAGALCSCYKEGKSIGVCHCDIGEHLSVHSNPCLGYTFNETAIGHAVQPAGRVDANYPQAAKHAFLGPAVSVGIAESPFHSLLGLFETEASGAPVAFGHFEYLLATTMGLKAPCNPWHFFSSSSFRSDKRYHPLN